jgi:hypothetical protein
MSEPLSESAQRGLAWLWDYTKEHGVARPPWSFRTASSFRLGAWVAQRRKVRGVDLQLDLLLESLPGWTWASPYDRAFADKLKLVTQLITDGRPIRDQQLRGWIHKQRGAAKRGELSEERLARLRAAGIFALHMHRNQPQHMCKKCTEE